MPLRLLSLPLLALVWFAPILAIWQPVFGAFVPLSILAISAFALTSLLIYGVPLIGAWRFSHDEAARAAAGEGSEGWLVPPAGGPRPLVVLIHGTFARVNTWTQADAPLARALDRRATVVSFTWSGANSMRSRRIAVDRLRRYIAALAGAGFGPITLIGHSHGGNIAMKACEDTETARHVTALVCLATPFLSAWRPRVRVVRGGVARAGMVLAASIPSWPMILLPSSMVASWDGASSPRVVAAYVGCLAIITVATALGFRVGRQFVPDDGSPALDADIAGSVCEPAAVAPLRARTLILSRGGDEADGMLKVASIINRQIVSTLHLDHSSGLDHPRGAGIVERRQGGVPWQLWVGTLQGAMSLVAAVSGLAFGVDVMRRPAGVFLTSAETPPGEWTHVHVAGAGTPDAPNLYHSSLYGDQETITLLVDWLGAREALVAIGPRP